MDEVPIEQCAMEPVKSCGMVNKIVPGLEEKEECVVMPVTECKPVLVARTIKEPGVQNICKIGRLK